MPQDSPSPKRVPPKKQILLVDDHPLMRRGQADLLSREPDLRVCGEAATAKAAMEEIERLGPDLVVVDLTLPDKDGVELIKDIHALHPSLPVLAMSMQEEAIYAPRVLRAGGRGYVMKSEGSAEQLAGAIRTVLRGEVALSPRMAAKVLQSMVGGEASRTSGPEEKLTDRELEILRLHGEGWSTEEVATRLHLSPKTVEVHRANMKQKLGFTSTPAFQRFAIQWVHSQRRLGA